uniref:SGNH hydrolase-type esterase domain-containing protein n=1 Tax=Octactis speculum TaxID=3111310 RepID=A0A6U3X4T5_9STRA|mmetsp:Transcript_54830/g.74961  ORF Transcript_54830/g.74961 Transcript_54830/m.74961 type:complete len:407 (+) Transcript_54830:70-1290(+)
MIGQVKTAVKTSVLLCLLVFKTNALLMNKRGASLEDLGSLLPFVAEKLEDHEEETFNAYRVEYAGYRLGAAHGAKGEANHLRGGREFRKAQEALYSNEWRRLKEEQEAEESQVFRSLRRHTEAMHLTEDGSEGQPKFITSFEPLEVRPLVLVLGSSVALGSGASSMALGWSGRLAQALKAHGVALQNEAVAGKETGYTFGRFQALPVRKTIRPSVVLVALSLANEGLKRCHGEAGLPVARWICDKYLNGVAQIAHHAEEMGAKVVICSPYPHDDMDELYEAEVQRVLLALRTARWPVIDFYTAVCDPAHYMRWTHGTTYDAGHPNDLGHQRMFEAINVENLVEMARSCKPPEGAVWSRKPPISWTEPQDEPGSPSESEVPIAPQTKSKTRRVNGPGARGGTNEHDS